MPLKDVEIRALKPQDRIYKKMDERGLYLEVRPRPARSWMRACLTSAKKVGEGEARLLAALRRCFDNAAQSLGGELSPLPASSNALLA